MQKHFLTICLALATFSLFSNSWPPQYYYSKFFPNKILLNDNFPSDADGVLILMQTKYRFVGVPISNVNLYAVQCSFYQQTGDTSTKYGIGDIALNDTLLFYERDSTYKSFGLDLSQDTIFTWKFAGNTSNILSPTNQFTTTKPLINLSSFNLDVIDTNLYRSSTFSYSHPYIQADSILYAITSDSVRIQKKVVGSSSGISFSPSELSSLPASNSGGVTIVIYNVMPANINGKKYYFQNNSVAVVAALHIN